MLRHVHQLIVWVFDGFCTNQTTEKSHGVACLAFGRIQDLLFGKA